MLRSWGCGLQCSDAINIERKLACKRETKRSIGCALFMSVVARMTVLALSVLAHIAFKIHTEFHHKIYSFVTGRFLPPLSWERVIFGRTFSLYGEAAPCSPEMSMKTLFGSW